MILVTVSDMVKKQLHAYKFGMLILSMSFPVYHANIATLGFLMFHLYFFLNLVGNL